MLDDFLRRHDGVITLAQALQAGLSRDAVNRRVRTGRWRRCSQGVFFAEDHAFTDTARVRSAVWGYGDNAVATGVTAAWWHQLTQAAPSVVEVTVPRARRLRFAPGTRLRRRDLRPADVIERHGLRVTTMELTAIEAAVRQDGGPALMDTALQQHTELPALWTAHVRNKGRHGSPRARIYLQAAGDGSRSKAERLFVSLLKQHNFTGWIANHPVGGYVVDVAFVGPRVAVEIDGWAYHSDPEAFGRDRNRQNALVLRGWRVLRFTWRDLTERPEQVIAELERAICGV
jgi:very-short-patch-repair endonuclease